MQSSPLNLLGGWVSWIEAGRARTRVDERLVSGLLFVRKNFMYMNDDDQVLLPIKSCFASYMS